MALRFTRSGNPYLNCGRAADTDIIAGTDYALFMRGGLLSSASMIYGAYANNSPFPGWAFGVGLTGGLKMHVWFGHDNPGTWRMGLTDIPGGNTPISMGFRIYNGGTAGEFYYNGSPDGSFTPLVPTPDVAGDRCIGSQMNGVGSGLQDNYEGDMSGLYIWRGTIPTAEDVAKMHGGADPENFAASGIVLGHRMLSLESPSIDRYGGYHGVHSPDGLTKASHQSTHFKRSRRRPPKPSEAPPVTFNPAWAGSATTTIAGGVTG